MGHLYHGYVSHNQMVGVTIGFLGNIWMLLLLWSRFWTESRFWNQLFWRKSTWRENDVHLHLPWDHILFLDSVNMQVYNMYIYIYSMYIHRIQCIFASALLNLSTCCTSIDSIIQYHNMCMCTRWYSWWNISVPCMSISCALSLHQITFLGFCRSYTGRWFPYIAATVWLAMGRPLVGPDQIHKIPPGGSIPILKMGRWFRDLSLKDLRIWAPDSRID